MDALRIDPFKDKFIQLLFANDEITVITIHGLCIEYLRTGEVVI